MFIDGQNLQFRCREHFGHPWIHPLKLANALVAEDRTRHGYDSHCLAGVRYYTGIHDPNRKPDLHREMDRRLDAYRRLGVHTEALRLQYDGAGRAREKGVDVRIAIDLTRLGTKGLYDVAIVVTEDSDLDEAVRDVYELRDRERWIAVENVLPWTQRSHTRWLPSARRRRPIDHALFAQVRDDARY